MKDDFNPNRPEDALKKALDELLEGRSSRAEISQDALSGMPPAGTAERCPEPGAWHLLLSGDAGPANALILDELLAHAAECSTCADHVHMMIAEASPEEAAEVGSLPTSSSEWQRNLAARLALTPHGAFLRPARNQSHRLYLWAGAGLAASLLLAVALTAWWRVANAPERLLAEAYTQSRTFDLREPGADFAEVTPETHLRGGAPGRESTSLLEGRARIERHLEGAPEDPHWLQLEARADVLEEKFDPAIGILDRLLAAGPATSGLLVDDASAYFQRGTATGSESDRATALEYLRRADELAPGDPVVLFNEAVVMEDRGQLMNAVETWNRYLHFERDARWLADGRRRLQALEQKLNQLKSHQGRVDQRLRTPQEMHALPSGFSMRKQVS